MRTYRLESEVWLDAPRREVFAFFADAANLQELTPGWVAFRVTSPTPIEMRPGATIDYRLKIRGLPLRWTSEVTVWDPPIRFVDEQRRGPYRRWIHEHEFVERDRGTVCRDRVTYAVPGGRLVERFLVRPDLERIFRYRRERLVERFGGREGEAGEQGGTRIAVVP